MSEFIVWIMGFVLFAVVSTAVATVLGGGIAALIVAIFVTPIILGVAK